MSHQDLATAHSGPRGWTAMFAAQLLLGALGSFVSLQSAAAQQAELPAGPNRDLVSHECQGCHDLSMVFGAAGQDRAGWSSTVDPKSRPRSSTILQIFWGHPPRGNRLHNEPMTRARPIRVSPGA
jgi:cytochrome c5